MLFVVIYWWCFWQINFNQSFGGWFDNIYGKYFNYGVGSVVCDVATAPQPLSVNMYANGYNNCVQHWINTTVICYVICWARFDKYNGLTSMAEPQIITINIFGKLFITRNKCNPNGQASNFLVGGWRFEQQICEKKNWHIVWQVGPYYQ